MRVQIGSDHCRQCKTESKDRDRPDDADPPHAFAGQHLPRHVEQDHAIGDLEGWLADLLLVNGDPLTDVILLQDHDRIAMIMKGGELYKAPELPR